MDTDIAFTSPDETTWVAIQRGWARGWRRLALPVVFLAYLVLRDSQADHADDTVTEHVAWSLCRS